MSTGAAAAVDRTGDGEITAVGIDTAGLADVEAALQRHGQRYLRFLLSPDERREISCAPADLTVEMATRWAAKEAVTKVLAPAPTDPWPWRQVEVLGLPDRPVVRLTGRPRELARARGVDEIRLAPGPSQAGRAVTMTATGLAHPTTTTDRREQQP